MSAAHLTFYELLHDLLEHVSAVVIRRANSPGGGLFVEAVTNTITIDARIDTHEFGAALQRGILELHRGSAFADDAAREQQAVEALAAHLVSRPAHALHAAGYQPDDIADMLGVDATTVRTALRHHEMPPAAPSEDRT